MNKKDLVNEMVTFLGFLNDVSEKELFKNVVVSSERTIVLEFQKFNTIDITFYNNDVVKITWFDGFEIVERKRFTSFKKAQYGIATMLGAYQ